ncbi:ribosomal protein L1-like protein [Dimargaris cristalligena]|uniref:Ribosomal protein n=1 Tax=Dimargaris cristalligena TaxID=215637 RepID=A0A4P9ZT63_9FUNG|nr:ribosomal protein L1-like protein [Dimargaris cristalligena]|eukprot:RKP36388.1 ribosomal protein L1-like protein [Dimargaris cristalligena]
MQSLFRVTRTAPTIRPVSALGTPLPTGLRSYRIRNTKKKKVEDEESKGLLIEDAIPILKAFEVGRPQATVELHVQLFHDRGSAPVRGTCLLPRAIKNEVRVLVFAEGEPAKAAQEAGATYVGGAELLPQVVDGTIQFDKCLCSLDMMPTVARIARFLGPKGLMPTKNKGTVTNDLGNAVRHAINTFDYRMNKSAIVNCPIAKCGFTPQEIAGNVSSVLNHIRANTPKTKKALIGTVHLSTTHGPSVPIRGL